MYETEAFNSQVLLWPGEEDAEWLAAFAGARADVLAFRKSIFSTVLGRDYRRRRPKCRRQPGRRPSGARVRREGGGPRASPRRQDQTRADRLCRAGPTSHRGLVQGRRRPACLTENDSRERAAALLEQYYNSAEDVSNADRSDPLGVLVSTGRSEASFDGESTDMWLGLPSGGEPVWIQYEFSRVVQLHEWRLRPSTRRRSGLSTGLRTGRPAAPTV